MSSSSPSKSNSTTKEPFLNSTNDQQEKEEEDVELSSTQNLIDPKGSPLVTDNGNTALPTLPPDCVDESADSPNISDSDDDNDQVTKSMAYLQHQQSSKGDFNPANNLFFEDKPIT